MSDSIQSKILADPDLTPEKWVRRYCELYGVKYHYKTNSTYEQGEVLESALLLSKMRLLAHNLDQSHLKGLLPDALTVWRRDEEREFIKQIRKRFSYVETAQDLTADWVEAATGMRSALDIAVMTHFIWQVRRKIFGLAVEHHLMPVLYGKSGGGKSVAMNALLKPLSEVAIGRDMTVFNDPFGRRQFTRNYVMVFDEMGKSHQTDVNSLKNIVTATEISWRGMNSEATHTAPQNCTFIGASNHPLRERIQDSTSGRRFWQLNCAPQLSWNSINSVNYESLWKSVDENGPCPLLPILPEIQEVQNREIRSKDIIEQWVDSACEPSDFNDKSPTTEELYRSFRGWCLADEVKTVPGLQTFARNLLRRFETMGWDVTSKKTYRGTTWSLRLRS